MKKKYFPTHFHHLLALLIQSVRRANQEEKIKRQAKAKNKEFPPKLPSMMPFHLI